MAYRVTLGVTMLLVLAELLHLLEWLVESSTICDFPQDCLNTAYPAAFQRAERWWLAADAVGLVTIVLALLRRAGGPSIARLGLAWVAAAGAYLLTPWARFDDPAEWMRFADPSDGAEFGGIAWWAVALLAGSLFLYGWNLVGSRTT